MCGMKKMVVFCAAVLCAMQAAGQSKSPSYSASGAFSTDVDTYMNPGSFGSVKFGTVFAFMGASSRYLDGGIAARFGKVYTAVAYSGNVFDYTGLALFGINMIKPAKPAVTPNKSAGNLQRPLFSNKVSMLIGTSGLNNRFFKSLGFKVTLETLSAKHIKDELYGVRELSVMPVNTAAFKNTASAVRFAFKDSQGKQVKTDGTDKSSVRIGFDWTGMRIPLGKRTLTIKPSFAVDINRSITKAVTNVSTNSGTITHTSGVWNNGNTILKLFLNMFYGEFSIGYMSFYTFFENIQQRYRYESILSTAAAGGLASGKEAIKAEQVYDQAGRRDMIHKITAGYKPSFRVFDSMFVFTPSLFCGCEVRMITMPHTLITTEITETKSGMPSFEKKVYKKEYTTKSREQKITVSPVTGLGFQYRILPGRLYLNAGFNVEYGYSYSKKEIIVPSVGSVTTDLTGSSAKPVITSSKAKGGTVITRTFAPKGTFGIGFQWHITESASLDTAFTVMTDFKNAAAARENCIVATAFSVKL